MRWCCWRWSSHSYTSSFPGDVCLGTDMIVSETRRDEIRGALRAHEGCGGHVGITHSFRRLAGLRRTVYIPLRQLVSFSSSSFHAGLFTLTLRPLHWLHPSRDLTCDFLSGIVLSFLNQTGVQEHLNKAFFESFLAKLNPLHSLTSPTPPILQSQTQTKIRLQLPIRSGQSSPTKSSRRAKQAHTKV